MCSHAEKCPVCDGTGIFNFTPECDGYNLKYYKQEITCHGCQGTGWVTVTDSLFSYSNSIYGVLV